MTSYLIISDTHAFARSATSGVPSILEVGTAGEALTAISDVLAEENLKPDWVLCPGDLGDKASPAGQIFVWEHLEALRKKLGAKYLVGAAGNHDMDSRFANSAFDPKANLQSLNPLFPGITQEDCDKYWSRHFCIHYEGDHRILNLNSSAFHGYGSATGQLSEIEYGRVSEQTIAQIVAEVSARECRVNILLTHHHIINNDHIYADEYSEMRGGNRLMHRLIDATKTSWIVVHGHLHYPELDYGRGSALAPVVLSAASATALNHNGSSDGTPNQFYVMDVANDDGLTDGWNPCGTIYAWYWSASGRWERSPSRHKVPYGTGFGSRLNPKQAADRFEMAFAHFGQPYVYFKEAFDHDALLRHLLPSDVDLAIRELTQRSYKITMAEQRAESTIRKV